MPPAAVVVVQVLDDIRSNGIGAMNQGDFDQPLDAARHDQFILRAVPEIAVVINLRVQVRIIARWLGIPQQRSDDRQPRGDKFAQRAAPDEIVDVGDEIPVAAMFTRLPEALVPDAAENAESDRVPFVRAELFDPFVDIRWIELDGGI